MSSHLCPAIVGIFDVWLSPRFPFSLSIQFFPHFLIFVVYIFHFPISKKDAQYTVHSCSANTTRKQEIGRVFRAKKKLRNYWECAWTAVYGIMFQVFFFSFFILELFLLNNFSVYVTLCIPPSLLLLLFYFVFVFFRCCFFKTQLLNERTAKMGTLFRKLRLTDATEKRNEFTATSEKIITNKAEKK